MEDMGNHVAVAHLTSLVRRWADSTGVVETVSTSSTNNDGLTCVLELDGGVKLCFDFVFTTGVETGDADDAIIEDLNAAWTEGRLDHSEIWVSGHLDDWSILARRGDDPPTGVPHAH
jgi:hypothetical protein